MAIVVRQLTSLLARQSLGLAPAVGRQNYAARMSAVAKRRDEVGGKMAGTHHANRRILHHLSPLRWCTYPANRSQVFRRRCRGQRPTATIKMSSCSATEASD